jgi:hypothetical protein
MIRRNDIMRFELAKILGLFAAAVLSATQLLAEPTVPAGAKPAPAVPAVAAPATKPVPVVPAATTPAPDAKPTPAVPAVTPPVPGAPVTDPAKPVVPSAEKPAAGEKPATGGKPTAGGKPAAGEKPVTTPTKTPVPTASAVSIARVERIRVLLRSLQDETNFCWKYQEKDDKLGSVGNKDGIVGAVLRYLRKSREFIVDPTVAVVTPKSLETETLEKIRRMVAIRYGVPLTDAWKAEAEAKFPLAKKGDKITFTYRMNPSSKETVSGRIEGMGDGKVIIRAIPYDLLSFEQNTEEEKQLVLRLNEGKTLLARRKYCDDQADAFEEERNTYQAKLISSMASAQDLLQKSSELNEKNGYIFRDNQWLVAGEVTKRLFDEETLRLAGAKAMWEAAAEAAARRRLASLDLLMRAAVLRGNISAEVRKEGCQTCRHPDAHLPGPCPVITCKCGKCPDCMHAPHPDAPCLVADCKCGKCPKCMHAVHQSPCSETGCTCGKVKAHVEPTRPTGPVKESSPWMIYAVVAGGILLVAGGIGLLFYIRFRRSMDERRRKKKDEFTAAMLIHEFWQKAKSDPIRFRYVAYQFPTEIEANSGFKRLSYVREKEGTVMIPPNVEYGFYEENHKHVVYIGGLGFGYSMWREAISMFPSIPGAEYYKVSEAPTVNSDSTEEVPTSEPSGSQADISNPASVSDQQMSDLFGDNAPTPEFQPEPPSGALPEEVKDLSLEELMALRDRTAEEAAGRSGEPPAPPRQN